MWKKAFLTALLLFGVFFGSGNLIFPPALGYDSGSLFWPAIIGFIISGVGLAVLTLIVGTLSTGSYPVELESKFSRGTSLVFLGALYLTIGPFFAIPRTAATSFQIGLAPIVGTGHFSLFLYSMIYFASALYLALTPSKLMARVGKVLTPIFVGLILLLIIFGVAKFHQLSPQSVAQNYQTSPLSTGFLEGYNTLDALAAVAFSLIAVNTLKSFGFKDKKEYLITIWLVGCFTTLFFGVLYVGLGYIGNHVPIDPTVFADGTLNKGSYILTTSSQLLFGSFGRLFLGLMVIITCHTTTTGLIATTAEFFAETFNEKAYKQYAILFTLIGFFIANLGLNSVITFSLPVLLMLYPVTIIIVFIIIANKLFALSKLGMKLCLAIVAIFSVVDVMASVLKISTLQAVFHALPLAQQQLEWILPGLIGIILMFILPDKIKGKAFDFSIFAK